MTRPTSVICWAASSLLALGMAPAGAHFQRWMAEGDFTHGREMAMFYLDVMLRPTLARVAATRNLAFQREVEDQRLFARAEGEELPQRFER